MEIRLETPLTKEKVKQLKAGDIILLSGYIYTARDAAHKRLIEMIHKEEALPVTVKDQIVYYAGPSPAKPEKVIGSAGPTTSYRMDPYTPLLLRRGLTGMIGKGDRSEEVIHEMQTTGAVYFAAVGGAAALLSNQITEAKIVAFEDLGTEAIRKLQVKDFPVIVVIDCQGNNLYQQEKERYKNLLNQE